VFALLAAGAIVYRVANNATAPASHLR
jgi:hypothetical protein